jgi:FPC/CPF motif-containing protein YcgG
MGKENNKKKIHLVRINMDPEFLDTVTASQYPEYVAYKMDEFMDTIKNYDQTVTFPFMAIIGKKTAVVHTDRYGLSPIKHRLDGTPEEIADILGSYMNENPSKPKVTSIVEFTSPEENVQQSYRILDSRYGLETTKI